MAKYLLLLLFLGSSLSCTENSKMDREPNKYESTVESSEQKVFPKKATIEQKEFPEKGTIIITLAFLNVTFLVLNFILLRELRYKAQKKSDSESIPREWLTLLRAKWLDDIDASSIKNNQKLHSLYTKIEVLESDLRKLGPARFEPNQSEIHETSEEVISSSNKSSVTIATEDKHTVKEIIPSRSTMVSYSDTIAMEDKHTVKEIIPSRSVMISYSEASVDSSGYFPRVSNAFQKMASVYKLTLEEGENIGSFEVVDNQDVWQRIASNPDEKLKACDLEKKVGVLKIETSTQGTFEKTENGKIKLIKKAKVIFYSN